MKCPHGHEGAAGCKPCESFVMQVAPRSLALARTVAEKLDPQARALVRQLVETLCLEIEQHYELKARDQRLGMRSLLESALRPVKVLR
jgi:hypothetical protein